jgi:hypothetical protein
MQSSLRLMKLVLRVGDDTPRTWEGDDESSIGWSNGLEMCTYLVRCGPMRSRWTLGARLGATGWSYKWVTSAVVIALQCDNAYHDKSY